jgi:hypothetical protein
MRSIGARFKAMPGVVDFRNYAEACARLAKSADTDASKTTLLKMAERWTALAVQADRIKQLVREADAVNNTVDAERKKPKSTRRSN